MSYHIILYSQGAILPLECGLHKEKHKDMYDIELIRKNPTMFNQTMQSRKASVRAAMVLELDVAKRKAVTDLQDLQQQRNSLTQKIAQSKQQGLDCTNEITASKQMTEKINKLTANSSDDLSILLSTVPNLLDSRVPVGSDEAANIEVRSHGTPRSFTFSVKPHYELGEQLGLLDFKKAADISGSRFVILKGDLSRLERALANFMLDMHTREFGYQEINHPVLVNEGAMYGVGQLPKFAADSFVTTDNMRLIPTGEVVLTNLVANSILNINDLPLRFTAYSQCFRSEAGSAGRDTRGMIRQHQFSKVELVSITSPENSDQELERMLNVAEEVLRRLELPYRVMLLCSGDIGFASKMTYDLEVWLPAQNTYREISSCSNCGDFQARRLKARYKNGKATHFVHTLNGSALAIGRTLVAIMENYQNADGSVAIPEVLRQYMNGQDCLRCNYR